MNEGNSITLGDVQAAPETEIFLLGYDQPLNFTSLKYESGVSGVTIQFPPLQKFLKKCTEYCEWGYKSTFPRINSIFILASILEVSPFTW